MSSLEFDGFSLTQGFDIKNLMDSASFQSLTAGVFKLPGYIHVTTLASLGWTITLWIINEFGIGYSKWKLEELTSDILPWNLELINRMGAFHHPLKPEKKD